MPRAPRPAGYPGAWRLSARAPWADAAPAPSIPSPPRSASTPALDHDPLPSASSVESGARDLARVLLGRTGKYLGSRTRMPGTGSRVRRSRSGARAIASPVLPNGSMHRILRVLEDLQLVLEPRDLIRFLRLLERVVVFVRGFPHLANLPIGVAQVLGDCRIAAGQIDRAFELFDSLLVFTLLVVHPPEAVDVKAVLGLNIEGALDELLRLLEVLALFGVGITDVVEGLGVLGVKLDRFLHLGHARFALLVEIEAGTQLEMKVIIARIDRDHVSRDRNRRRIVFLLGVHFAQKAHQLSVVGLEL